jgi:hypothetical protein
MIIEVSFPWLWLAVLLVVFQLKHFLADFPFQNGYMLRKFSSESSVWVPALAAHAGVHGFMTFGISLIFLAQTRSDLFIIPAFMLGLTDLIIHFWMDRFKASPNYLGRFKALSGAEYKAGEYFVKHPLTSSEAWKEWQEQKRGNTYFWWSLGLDQMVHHLTHYYIIYRLVTFYFTA